jgi:hypothetical protein
MAYCTVDHRYDFILLIPSDLANHDTHPDARIEHNIHVEVEGDSLDDINPPSRSTTGVQPPKAKSRSKSKSRSYPTSTYPSNPPSRSTSRHVSPPKTYSPMPIASPEYTPKDLTPNPESLSAALSQTLRLDASGSTSNLPEVPPYSSREGGQGIDEIGWLHGTLRAKRYVEVLYNLNPNGGVTDLDVRSSSSAAGLGTYDLRVLTDCVSDDTPLVFPASNSIACALKANFTALSPPRLPRSRLCARSALLRLFPQ